MWTYRESSNIAHMQVAVVVTAHHGYKERLNHNYYMSDVQVAEYVTGCQEAAWLLEVAAAEAPVRDDV
jgi:hypothetical protein